MILTIFSPIRKRLSKLLLHQEITTDNAIFRLHCILTVAVLLASSIVLTTTQLVGKPIQCVMSTTDRYKEWAKPIETWCWVNSTFTMPVDIKEEVLYEQWKTSLREKQASNAIQNNAPPKRLDREFYGHHRRIPGQQEAYPGVFNPLDSEDSPPRYYKYYQWVCFMLFLQGILCYLPKMLWNILEGELMSKLATGLHALCSSEEREKRINNIICYILRYRGGHKCYALSYWFCESLCLLNLGLQMWLMNCFLGGSFLSYGIQALQYSDRPQYERDDPLIYIFPRVTKCTLYYYGPSGSIVNLDNLCVLPQNVINEKVYIILWFWYIILALMFVGVLVYRVTIVSAPGFRVRLLAARARKLNLADVRDLVSRLDHGDWWIFYMLSKNIDPLAYRDMVTEFNKRENKNTLLNSHKHN